MVMVQDREINIDRSENLYLGIDVGSVSTKFAIINENMKLLYSTWARSTVILVLGSQGRGSSLVCGSVDCGSVAYIPEAI